MTTKPTHRAYLVEDPGSGKKPRWTEVGAVWPHIKGGGGFDVVLPPGLAVSGRIVCTPVLDKDEAPQEGA